MPEPFQSVSPSGLQWILDIDAVLFGQPQQQVAGHPHLVGGLLGALAEDLEFPLAFGDFRVDAFVVDAGREAKVEVLFHDLAGNIADIRVADAGVVRPLRRRIAARREAERTAVLVEEIFLLEAEPCAGSSRIVARLFVACGVTPSGIMTSHITSTPLVRAPSGYTATGLSTQSELLTFRLHGRRAVETPQRQLLQRRERREFLDLRFAAQIRRRRIAVEPNILELVLGH